MNGRGRQVVPLVLLAVTVLMLGAVAVALNLTLRPDEQAASAATSSTPVAPQDREADRERELWAWVTDEGLESDGSLADYVGLAEVVCEGFPSDFTQTRGVDELSDDDDGDGDVFMTRRQAEEFIALSTRLYCPQHLDELPR